jgi:hypothetical protein
MIYLDNAATTLQKPIPSQRRIQSYKNSLQPRQGQP